jgi:hypothetical protein
VVVLREIDGKTTGTKLGMIKSLDEETALVAMYVEFDEDEAVEFQLGGFHCVRSVAIIIDASVR